MRRCATIVLSLAISACSGSAGSGENAIDVGGSGNPFATGGARAAGGSTSNGFSTNSSKSTGGTAAIGGTVSAGGANATSGTKSTGGTAAAGGSNATGGSKSTGGTAVAGGSNATGGSKPTDGTAAAGGANATGGTKSTGGTAAAGGVNATGGTKSTGGAAAAGGANATGGTKSTGGAAAAGGANATGGTKSTGGASATGGSTSQWANIRVVGNHLCDRWGKPFALRSIESMFGNGTSNAKNFVAGHKALGANALGPLPNSSVSDTKSIEALLTAAYEAGLVIGLNADHTNQGERFFQNTQLQAVINRYPNVFLQEAVELGTDMSASEWVQAAKDKVDAYVGLYPDKPLKIGSPFGGRSPRVALDHCEEVVDYYYSKGGRGGLIFTCQLYWKAATSGWSYQEENGFPDGLDGILAAVDAMAASPCLFVPGLDNEDDVGYTGWREVMDHVRTSNSTAGMRLGYQWWVYYNSGDAYDNDLTTNASDALSGITSTGTAVKAKLDADREYIELGPMNP